MSTSASASPADKRPRTRQSIAHVPAGGMDGAMFEDKENMTADVGSSAFMAATKGTFSSSSKSRSKSLGPGGLNALNEGASAGNARKMHPMPRSILKPAVPLSPLPEIPSRKIASPGEKATTPTGSPQRPATPRSGPTGSPVRRTPTKVGTSPRVVDSASALRRKEREEIQKQREARRKSMANRRVSFAPEATLHTWSEPPQTLEPITSSNSGGSPARAGDGGQGPSTPSGNGSSMQRRRKRRSSGLHSIVPADVEEVPSSSPYSGSETGSGDDTITTPQKDNESGDTESDSDTEEEVDEEDNEDNTTSSAMSIESTQADEDPSLDAKLHAAAHNANTTSRMAFDENGEASMEIAGDEITNAFKPWAQRWEEAMNAGAVPSEPASANGPSDTRPNPGDSASPDLSKEDNGEDMSMDMTKAVGRILQSQGKDRQSLNLNRGTNSRRPSIMQRRKSTDEGSDVGANTMEFTTEVGGIRSRASAVSGQDENEEMSMEFTTAFGKIKGNQGASSPAQKRRETTNTVDADGDMEMTEDIGRIVESNNLAHDANDTAPMELTVAVGGILQSQKQMNTEPTPKIKPTVKTSATGSPVLSGPRSRAQPRMAEQQSSLTPSKSPGTPSKQITPQVEKPSSPNKTTPNRNITLRSPSPKMLFQKEIQAQASSPKSSKRPQLFETNSLNGQLTPRIVLEPKLSAKRRNSGIGMDKEGLGSPRVAAILDRRTSIGENSTAFAPSHAGARGVRFDDPRKLDAEVTQEREEDERRESGRYTLEHEDEHTEKEVTGSLKDMIHNMSPKKNRVLGRKSLAVGSAKGLLGKRPAELDDEQDDYDDEDGTPKGLRGRQSSPVKKIRLQGPPSMADATGRRPRHTLGVTSANEKLLTPGSRNAADMKSASTPSHHGKYADMNTAHKPMPAFATDGAPLDPSKITAGEGQDNVSLQEFLDMTNIRFMELNTTRRRHTVAPGSARRGSSDRELNQEDQSDPAKQVEDAAAAGASTIPMLELFQHSCRELKKYISEGRHMVKAIETDVHNENPALFREYISAAPKEKHIMDNQFKNMKTHARILSQGMWYEWRMKLLDSLKEGLLNTSKGFKADEDALASQEKALEVLPTMIEMREKLHQEATELNLRVKEIADCDQEELGAAREHLTDLDKQIAERKALLAERQDRLKDMDEAVDLANEAKTECQQAIREAQRVREECRGWSVADVAQVKATVEELEAKHDWHVNSMSGAMITMTYASALELTFNMGAYPPLLKSSSVASPSTSLSLSYVGDQPSSSKIKPGPLTTTKRFFLQLLRAHLHSLIPHATHASKVLQFVANSWTIGQAVEASVKNLELVARVPVVEIRGDDRLGVRAELLLKEARSKLEMDFAIGVSVRDDSISIRVSPSVQVVYGPAGRGREGKMATWLKERVAEGAAWGLLAGEVRGRLEGRGKTLTR